METKIEFQSLSVLFNNITITNTISNKIDLYKWLKSHRLSEIKEFPNWIYLINEVPNVFKIKRGRDKGWDVFKLEEKKVYFSFKVERGIDFINDFEKKFKVILDPPVSGNATASMNGVTPKQ